MSDATRHAYATEFSGGGAQGATIPAVRGRVQLTTDGRPHIYLSGLAFAGESYLFGTFSLQEVMEHEFIHAGGQGKTPGRLGGLRHDLAGFGPYNSIIEACR